MKPSSHSDRLQSDFPLLQEWLSAPHAAAWWNERLDLAGIEVKYGRRVSGTVPASLDKPRGE